MTMTPLRHPSLSSIPARKSLDHRAAMPEFQGLFSVIDQLRALHDGLSGVRQDQDPTMTKEANALAYRRRYEAAVERAGHVVKRQISNMVELEQKAVSEAHRKAGIAVPPPEASEIRSALRGMSKKERDAALTDALQRGDASVIASVLHSPSPFLVGEVGTPVATMARLFVDQNVPELKQTLQDIEGALTHLQLAWGGFKESADKMRDPAAEDRAEQGAAASKKAQALLDAAMAGQAAAPTKSDLMAQHEAAQGNVRNETTLAAAE